MGDAFASRQKRGFEVPLDQWFRGPLARPMAEAVVHGASPIDAWIEPRAVRRLWDEHQTGRQNHGPTLWKLLMLDAWARRYLHAAPPDYPQLKTNFYRQQFAAHS